MAARLEVLLGDVVCACRQQPVLKDDNLR
jgi:hypothetical protein